MKHTDIIRQLCSLQTDVAAHIGPEHPADCFCGENGFWDTPGYNPDTDYRNDGRALEFIKAAVIEKIARERTTAPSGAKPTPTTPSPSSLYLDALTLRLKNALAAYENHILDPKSFNIHNSKVTKLREELAQADADLFEFREQEAKRATLIAKFPATRQPLVMP